MPTFEELKKKKHVAEHPLFDDYDRRMAAMRQKMTKTSEKVDLDDIFSKVKQVGMKSGVRDLNAYIQEAAIATQEVVNVLDWPLVPRVEFRQARKLKYARHDESQLVSGELLFNLRFATTSGAVRNATIFVPVVSGAVVPPSTMMFEDRLYVLGQGAIDEIIRRNSSYFLDPLRRQYQAPNQGEELDIAVERRNEMGYQPRRVPMDENYNRRTYRRKEEQLFPMMGQEPGGVPYEIGDLVQYEVSPGEFTTAIVTERHPELWGGKPGFSGIDPATGMETSGFEESIVEVVEKGKGVQRSAQINTDISEPPSDEESPEVTPTHLMYPNTKTPIEAGDSVKFNGLDGSIRGKIVELDPDANTMIVNAKGMEYRVTVDDIEPLPRTFKKMWAKREAQETRVLSPEQGGRPDVATDPTMVQQTDIYAPTEQTQPQYGAATPTADMYNQVVQQPEMLSYIEASLAPPTFEEQVSMVYDAVRPLSMQIYPDQEIDWHQLTQDLVTYVGQSGMQTATGRKLAARIIAEYVTGVRKAGDKMDKKAQQFDPFDPTSKREPELQKFTPPGYDLVLGDMVQAEEEGLDTFPRSYAHVEKNYILKRLSTCSSHHWMVHLTNDGFIINPYGSNRGRMRPGTERIASKKVGKYVLKRNEDGMYVSRPGSLSSYTNDRGQAAEYDSLEEAQRNACGNESIFESFGRETLVSGGAVGEAEEGWEVESASKKKAQEEQKMMDLRIYLMDDTEYWTSLPKGIKKVYSGYLFDANLGVHVAELTPSAELHLIDTVPVFEDFVYEDDELREQLYDYIMEGAADTEPVTYVHLKSAIANSHPYDEVPRPEDEEEQQEIFEDALESLRGNQGVWEQFIYEEKSASKKGDKRPFDRRGAQVSEDEMVQQYIERAESERAAGGEVNYDPSLPSIDIKLSNGEEYHFREWSADELLKELPHFIAKGSKALIEDVLLAIAQNW